jgi:dinuclear metal center YbgI/SA1388 family protein
MKIVEFLRWAETIWPLDSAEEWDNPGLISGSTDAEVSKVLLTVDITEQVVQEAIDAGCDFIFAHHPLLLGGLDSLRQDNFKGRILALAITNQIGLFAAHTNADIVTNGVSDALAEKLGLTAAVALDGAEEGHGRMGRVRPQTLESLLATIKQEIPASAKGIAFIGALDMKVETVALVAGSGMGFAPLVSADVFITSDVKHHPALDFKEQAQMDNRALVEISHYAAESIWLERLAEQLSKAGLQSVISKVNTDPWDGVVK